MDHLHIPVPPHRPSNSANRSGQLKVGLRWVLDQFHTALRICLHYDLSDSSFPCYLKPYIDSINLNLDGFCIPIFFVIQPPISFLSTPPLLPLDAPSIFNIN
ncbi:hypothetical protein S245_037123 [Arachis hypogaea]